MRRRRAVGYTATDMKTALYTAAQLKAGGYTAVQLNAGGYTAVQLCAAAYAASSVKSAYSFSVVQLKDAGCDKKQIFELCAQVCHQHK